MMNALKHVEELEKSGFTDDQAKAAVNVWIQLMNDEFATMSDIKDVVHKLDLMDSRLTIKLGGIVIAGITVLGFILK